MWSIRVHRATSAQPTVKPSVPSDAEDSMVEMFEGFVLNSLRPALLRSHHWLSSRAWMLV
jgi:hypothetical protein